jgi:L-asparaginase
MALVQLVATGGTIASRATAAGRLAQAGGAELLSVTAVPAGVDVRVVDLAARGGFAWQPQDLRALIRAVAEQLAGGVDGVVLTHGTDTMEELSFLLDLVHDDPRPVVCTGAQRPFDDPGPDGPGNLADALAVASSPLSRQRGVLLCFDGYVFAARGVAKVDTLGAHAFDAPGRGPVLRVAGGTVRALSPAARPPALPFDHATGELPRVDVIPLYVGADATLLRAAVDAGARGLVLAGFGAGNANPAILDAVREVVAGGVPVLVCSRVPAGPVAPLYTGGGGADLAAAGAVFGSDLSPWQGRMLLTVSLTLPDPPTALRGWLGRQEARILRAYSLTRLPTAWCAAASPARHVRPVGRGRRARSRPHARVGCCPSRPTGGPGVATGRGRRSPAVERVGGPDQCGAGRDDRGGGGNRLDRVGHREGRHPPARYRHRAGERAE